MPSPGRPWLPGQEPLGRTAPRRHPRPVPRRTSRCRASRSASRAARGRRSAMSASSCRRRASSASPVPLARASPPCSKWPEAGCGPAKARRSSAGYRERGFWVWPGAAHRPAPVPVLRHPRRQRCPRPPGASRFRIWEAIEAAPSSPACSPGFPTASIRCSASADGASRAAKPSGWPWPGRSSATPASCSSTNQRRTWTRPPRRR